MAGARQAAPTEVTSSKITVEEALTLPCLRGARLVAGDQGKNNRIRVVNIMEVPDIARWMRGGELLLTTGYPLRDDPGGVEALVRRLADRGLAALGVKVGPYLEQLSAGTLAVADDLGFPLIALPAEVMFNDILSEVLGTVLNRQAVELDRSRAIHEELTAVALSGGSYQEIIDVLGELSDCPAAVLDDRGWVVASTGSPEVDTPPGASLEIRLGTSMRGQVAIWADSAGLRDHQLVALEHATTVATLVTAQERAVANREQRYRALLLTELTTRRPWDRAEMGRRAAAMGWDLHVPRAAVLMEINELSEGALAAEHTVEDQLVPLVRGAAGANAIIWGVQAGLAMLVESASVDSLRRLCHGVRDAVTTAHPSWKVMVAAGTVRSDFADFHLTYHESVETLTLGRELHGRDFVLCYDELGVYRLLGHLPTAELQHLVDEMLGPLLEYDRAHNTNLVQSLDVYLLRNRNGVETANQLHIHYNTLRYRLDKIERVTGGLERHPMSRLQTELAVHAYRQLAAQARK
jgi:PucR family transcriptional regulator, purine catabolism regulatory protein